METLIFCLTQYCLWISSAPFYMSPSSPFTYLEQHLLHLRHVNTERENHRYDGSQLKTSTVGIPFAHVATVTFHGPRPRAISPHTAEETSLQTSTLHSKVLWWGTVISLHSLKVNKQPAVSAAESKQHSTRWEGEAGRAIRCGEDSVPCCVPTCHSATHNALSLLVPPARHAVFCHYPTCVPAQGCSHTYTLDDERLCD